MNSPIPQEHDSAALEHELAGVIPGFEVVDRGVDVRESLRIDWVGLDADGAWVLVLWTDGSGSTVVLDVLDALAYVRSHADVLSRHWRLPPGSGVPGDAGDSSQAQLDLRAVCLAERFDVVALERLTETAGAALQLFEVRTVHSEMGHGSYLVPARHPVLGTFPGSTRVSFTESLSDELGALARLFVSRMARVDERLECVESATRAEWRLDGEVLADLRAVGAGLEAGLAGYATAMFVHSENDIDEFIDHVFDLLFASAAAESASVDGDPPESSGPLDGLPPGPLDSSPSSGPSGSARFSPGSSPGHSARGGAGRRTGERFEAPEPDEFGREGQDLAQIELIPMDSGALLTPEEIEAFRD